MLWVLNFRHIFPFKYFKKTCNSDRSKKWVALILILSIASIGHFTFVNLEKPKIGGDDHFYSYNSIYVLASGLRFCRFFFRSETCCGIKQPQHPYLTKAFSITGMDKYLAGQISYKQFINYANGFQIDVIEKISNRIISNPLELLFSRANLTSFTLGFCMWLFGPSYKGFIIFQSLLLVIASAVIFEMGYRLSNTIGATISALGWIIYTVVLTRGHFIIPQVIASVVFLFGLFFLLLGIQSQKGYWIFISCFTNGVASFYDIGLRPSVFVTMTGLIIGYYFFHQSKKNLLIWALLWVGCVVLFTVTTYFLRSQPEDASESLSFYSHVFNVILGVQKSVNLDFTLYDDGFWLSEKGYQKMKKSREKIDNLKQLRNQFNNIKKIFKTVPISAYRLWSSPWIHTSDPKKQFLRLMIHRLYIIIGFAGLCFLLGYKDWRMVWGWIFVGGLTVFTLLNCILVIETRRALPWLGPLWTLGGALLGKSLANSRKNLSQKCLYFGLLAILLLTTAGYPDFSIVSIPLSFVPSKLIFGLVLFLHIIVMVSILIYLLNLIRPQCWQWKFIVGPLLLIIIIFFNSRSNEDRRVVR
ncbi:hypothetical protein ACFL27_27195, partial [candidate division CSSED10-310 bacterium]